jgi:hypothetical protein
VVLDEMSTCFVVLLELTITSEYLIRMSCNAQLKRNSLDDHSFLFLIF